MSVALTSMNLTRMGMGMGMESVFPNWCIEFRDESISKKFAERDYRRNGGREEIVWSNGKTQDLSYVQYIIREKKELDS